MIANEILNQFKAHPDAWQVVDRILSGQSSPNTKFIAVQILDEAVNVSTTTSINFLLDSVADPP